MKINLIAAIGEDNELGKNNDLIWKLKEDMAFFKKTTIGHPVVMGRKTFDSLPNVLPERKNIIISTKEIENKKIEVYKSIRAFLIKYKDYSDDVFVIGGSSIYNQFIDLATNLYITHIMDVNKEADVYFPKINQEEWDREVLSYHQENSISFSHVLYKRKDREINYDRYMK